MIVKLLTEHHLEFLSLNGGCTGSSEPINVKMPHCWNFMHWLILYLFSVQPQMELKPNCGSDRAWVWTSTSDFADGEPKPELLAIRFANSESKYKSANPYRNDIVKLPHNLIQVSPEHTRFKYTLHQRAEKA